MSEFDPDWYAEQGRTLAWYVDRARKGDQRARERALQLIAGSLSPAGLAQTGGVIDPQLQGLLMRAAASYLAPQPKKGRKPKDLFGRQFEFALCCDLHKRVVADQSSPAPQGVTALAKRVLEEHLSEKTHPHFGADNLLKCYRDWARAPGDPLGRWLESQSVSDANTQI